LNAPNAAWSTVAKTPTPKALAKVAAPTNVQAVAGTVEPSVLAAQPSTPDGQWHGHGNDVQALQTYNKKKGKR